MKSDEIGTTLKHPKTINGNVKNLSKSCGAAHDHSSRLHKSRTATHVGEVRIKL
jgi:hypothetical protein